MNQRPSGITMPSLTGRGWAKPEKTQNSRYLGRDSNRKPLEYESGVSSIDQPVRYHSVVISLAMGASSGSSAPAFIRHVTILSIVTIHWNNRLFGRSWPSTNLIHETCYRSAVSFSSDTATNSCVMLAIDLMRKKDKAGLGTKLSLNKRSQLELMSIMYRFQHLAPRLQRSVPELHHSRFVCVLRFNYTCYIVYQFQTHWFNSAR
jgi:hypothetical protein